VKNLSGSCIGSEARQAKKWKKIVKEKELQESGTPFSATLLWKETWHGPCCPSKSRASLALGHSAKRSALARE